MAIGKEIISAYAGPASVESFQDLYQVSTVKTHKINYSESELNLHKHYQTVRDMRENNIVDIELLSKIIDELKDKYHKDWLLPLEIYELVFNSNVPLKKIVNDLLTDLKSDSNLEKLIADGMDLIS